MTPLKPTSQASDDIRFRPLKRNALLRQAILDDLLAGDHPVRLIDSYVARLDVTMLLEPIRARHGCPGAPVLDPQMLLALWLFATIEGITSARELARRCRRDLPYLWLSGQTRPNYHTLADFFSQHQSFLETTFEEHLEVLLEQGLVTLAQVTLDGRKIPASASKESFHREPTLSQHRQEAKEHLEKLAQQRTLEEQHNQHRKKAQERAARERQQRLDDAVETVKKRQQERALRDRKDASAPEEARASETDPDARKMKMSHGGFVPAYNTQTVTDTQHGLIVAVQVTEQASDNGWLGTMLEKVEEQTGRAPAAALVDGGYASQPDIQKAESNGTKIYMPPKTARAELKQGKNPYQRKRGDTKEIEMWRVRMGTPEAQAIYQRRAPVAEGVHAQQSNRGWKRFRLRGLAKAGVEALWQALAHNLRVLMARNRLSGLMVRAAATA